MLIFLFSFARTVCWFDAGHSDSADPDTYKLEMLAEAAAAKTDTKATIKDESTSLREGQAAKNWDYIRVQCLGILPGLVCPHADMVQSNGVLRVTDFDSMLLRHSGERGICIDHFAALCVEDNQYHILSLDGRPGSVLENGNFSLTRKGVPGVWLKEVIDGKVCTTLASPRGDLWELLKDASETFQDPKIETIRIENPIVKIEIHK